MIDDRHFTDHLKPYFSTHIVSFRSSFLQIMFANFIYFNPQNGDFEDLK